MSKTEKEDYLTGVRHASITMNVPQERGTEITILKLYIENLFHKEYSMPRWLFQVYEAIPFNSHAFTAKFSNRIIYAQ